MARLLPHPLPAPAGKRPNVTPYARTTGLGSLPTWVISSNTAPGWKWRGPRGAGDAPTREDEFRLCKDGWKHNREVHVQSESHVTP